MAITEIALLSITNPSASPASLHPDLSRMKETLIQGSGHAFTFYSGTTGLNQKSDTSDTHLLILGSWDSPAAHKTFLTSDANQELLKLADGKLGVEFMVHLDVDVGRAVADDGAVESQWPKWVKVFKYAGDAEQETRRVGHAEVGGIRGKAMEGSMGEDVLGAAFEMLWAGDENTFGLGNEQGVVGVFREVNLGS